MPRENLKREPLMASLHRLSRDGRSWIAAEAALAQAEVASDGKRLAVIFALMAVVFGSLFTAVILLSAFLVSLLAPFVSGLANAAGILGLLLLILATLLGWRIWFLAAQEFGLASVFKRWWNIAAKNSGPEEC
jgi:Putative Actinobacterial Holin-X, holin superfamily III